LVIEVVAFVSLFFVFTMSEDLAELCHRMNLSDHEKNHFRLSKERVSRSKEEAQFSILFKLLTARQFNGEALKSFVCAMWAPTGGLLIRNIEDNLFLAVFTSQNDMDRVFVQSPWTFDKKLIQIVRFEGNLQLTAVQFTHAAFWICVINLPIKYMSAEVGEDIGAIIGKFLEVDVLASGLAWGRFLRLRVEIELGKPLMRGYILQFAEEAPFWVDFRYEHLPTFCYRCDVIGHSGSDCLAGRRSGSVGQFPNDNYGSLLRAQPVRSSFGVRQREKVSDGENSRGKGF
jgi:hypothetical protein